MKYGRVDDGELARSLSWLMTSRALGRWSWLEVCFIESIYVAALRPDPEGDGVDVVAVGPGEDAVVNGDEGEDIRIAQLGGEWAVVGNHGSFEVKLGDEAVLEAKGHAMGIGDAEAYDSAGVKINGVGGGAHGERVIVWSDSIKARDGVRGFAFGAQVPVFR